MVTRSASHMLQDGHILKGKVSPCLVYVGTEPTALNSDRQLALSLRGVLARLEPLSQGRNQVKKSG